MTIDLYFIRHGQTAYNPIKVFQGQCDRASTPGVQDQSLDETGRVQAKDAAARLLALSIKPDAVLSSDMKRAIETAAPIAEAFHLTPLALPGLREMFFGAEQEGTLTSEFKKKNFNPPLTYTDPASGQSFTIPDGETLRAHHKSTDPVFDHLAHPGGETKAQARARALTTITEYVRAHPDHHHIVIVTHNALARFLFPANARLDHGECLHATFDPASGTLKMISKG